MTGSRSYKLPLSAARDHKRSDRGVSPIIATIFLCSITIVAVASISPLISSQLSSPVPSVAVTKAVLLKQDNYLLLIVNVKNTGSCPLTLSCTLYDSALNPYSAGSVQVVPSRGSTSFIIESQTLGSTFSIGNEYMIDLTDSNYGRMAEMRVFCMGR
ncbi:MAG: archaellin/type IV pilin N-terminal domain-containing protein [Candidatus Methanosuratincola petrocarbonis]